MIFLFWISAFLIFYTYAGYPLILWILTHVRPQPVNRAHTEPKVSILMSAFNEEKHIERKLLNLLDLNYPESKLEILVGSDGCSDTTDLIVSRFRSRRVRFFRFVHNLGKPQVLNALAQEAEGSILIFTDARQELDRNAVEKLVRNFYDPKIGCVSGELLFRSSKNEGIGHAMGLYWRYEKFLRKCESKIGSMLGATGALYALRKYLFTPLPSNMLVDDMFLPLTGVQKGYRAILDTQARVYDDPSVQGSEEVKRKIRTLAGNYQIFGRLSSLLNPRKSPVAWQLISHKFLRLMMPFALIALLVSNLGLLDLPGYPIFLGLQLAFYLLAIGGAWHRRGKNPPVSKGIGFLPYTFCLLNYAALMAIIRFKTQKQNAAWERAYA